MQIIIFIGLTVLLFYLLFKYQLSKVSKNDK